MVAPRNQKMAATVVADADEIAIGTLLSALGSHADLPLEFFHEGRPVKPGYHVTEVKAGRFAALDCGANAEAWTEIFIQLWDVNEDQRRHMAAGKFAAIIRKVADHVALDQSAKLTFEVSDGVQPMQLYRASTPAIRDGEVHIALSPRPASCKPRDRWLVEEASKSSCCSAKAEQPCCN